MAEVFSMDDLPGLLPGTQWAIDRLSVITSVLDKPLVSPWGQPRPEEGLGDCLRCAFIDGEQAQLVQHELERMRIPCELIGDRILATVGVPEVNVLSADLAAKRLAEKVVGTLIEAQPNEREQAIAALNYVIDVRFDQKTARTADGKVDIRKVKGWRASGNDRLVLDAHNSPYDLESVRECVARIDPSARVSMNTVGLSVSEGLVDRALDTKRPLAEARVELFKLQWAHARADAREKLAGSRAGAGARGDTPKPPAAVRGRSTGQHIRM